MRMLYKPNGEHLIDGVLVDYKIVEDDDIDTHIADGWFKSVEETVNTKKPAQGEVKKAK